MIEDRLRKPQRSCDGVAVLIPKRLRLHDMFPFAPVYAEHDERLCVHHCDGFTPCRLGLPRHMLLVWANPLLLNCGPLRGPSLPCRHRLVVVDAPPWNDLFRALLAKAFPKRPAGSPCVRVFYFGHSQPKMLPPQTKTVPGYPRTDAERRWGEHVATAHRRPEQLIEPAGDGAAHVVDAQASHELPEVESIVRRRH